MNNSIDEFQKIKKKPLFVQMLIMGFPLMVAQAINILYNVVDRLYITGMKSEDIANLGDIAFSGLTICFPVILILSSFAGLIGGGGMPIASIKIGEKKVEYAEKVLRNCFLFAIGVCVVVTAIVFIFKDGILNLFGAGEENFAYANDYLTIYLCGTIFVFLTMTLNPFITAQGKTKVAMLTIIIGAVTNIALDPLFIFTFNMGVKGAALATIISQAMSCIFVIVYLTRPTRYLRLKFPTFKLDFSLLKKVFAIGVSPWTFQVTEALVQIALLSSFKKFGGEDYVAFQTAMGFIITASQLVIFPIIGFNSGTQALLGYNYGAKDLKTFRKIMIRSYIFLATVFTIMFAMFLLFGGAFAKLMINNAETIKIAEKGIKIYWLAMPFVGFLMTVQLALIATRQALLSFIIAVLRKVVLLLPLAMILPMFFGVYSIFYSAPIADAIAIITAVCIMLVVKKNIMNPNSKLNLKNLEKAKMEKE